MKIENNIFKYIYKGIIYSIAITFYNWIYNYYSFMVSSYFIIFTILFEIIYLLFFKNYLFVLIVLSIIAYCLQYSEINYKIFRKYKPYLKAALHIVDLLSIAVTWLTLEYIKLFEKLKKNRIKSIIFCIIIFYFIYNYNILGQFRGFAYSGIKNNIAVLCLFIFFYLIPFESIINRKLYFNIIRVISRYTGGIYYFHPIIYDILKNLNYLKQKPILTCLLFI